MRIVASRCRHRLCPACAAARGAIVRKNIEFLAAQAGKRLSLITLTLVHTWQPLRVQLDKITEAWRELRRSKVWKDAVDRAIWLIECKKNAKHEWHVHLHLLAAANYIRPDLLSAAWYAATKTSKIVHVKRISGSNGAKYVSKYVTKPVDETIYDNQDAFDEFTLAIRGKRFIGGTGKWYGIPLARTVNEEIDLANGTPDDPTKWRYVSTVDEMIERATAGDAYAIQTLKLLGHEQRSGP